VNFTAKWFKEDEFACTCGCGGKKVHPKLVELLDATREELGQPLRVTSSYRCEARNTAVGGVKRSLHLEHDGVGWAADITYARRDLRDNRENLFRLFWHAERAAERLGLVVGLGLYEPRSGGFLHVDVRGCRPKPMKAARWLKWSWPRMP
jgi:uncharacterized protein YcbK (DUF882 family)